MGEKKIKQGEKSSFGISDTYFWLLFLKYDENHLIQSPDDFYFFWVFLIFVALVEILLWLTWDFAILLYV